METWEYLTAQMGMFPNGLGFVLLDNSGRQADEGYRLTPGLNTLGEDDWELVGIMGDSSAFDSMGRTTRGSYPVLIFKRRKP